MQKHLPPIDVESAPFWEGCNQEKLVLQNCNDCAKWQFYPRMLCQHCSGQQLSWQQVSGRATVRTFSIVRRAVSAGYDADVPYVVALVALAEGPTMMTNIVACDVQAVKIGMPVQVDFNRYSEEVNVPVFKPVDNP